MANELGVRWRFGVVDQLSATVDKLKNKFPKLTKEVRTANNAFKVINKSTAGFSKKVNSLSRGFKSAGKDMSIGLSAPIVGFGAIAVRTATTFQNSMNNVSAKSGATGDGLRKLELRAREMGAATAFSASEAADGMAFLAQAGFSAVDIYKAIPDVLNLAAASNIDLARAGDIASNVMGAFNITADETARVADVLSKATASSNIDMEMLAEAMTDAGPVALKFGASLEETTALIGKLGDAGIQGSKAGTTLKNMFLNLSAPTKEIKGIIQSLGVNVLDPASGKLRTMTDILVDMNKAFKSKGIDGAKKLAILDKVFGKRAIAGAGVLLSTVEKLGSNGKNAIESFTDSLNNSQGASKNMADTMMRGLPGALKTLSSRFEEMQLAIMDPSTGISQAFGSVVNAITGVIEWISKLDPSILAAIAVMAGLVAAIGPVLFIFGVFLSMLPGIITALNLMGVSMVMLQTSILPLILIVAKFLFLAGLIAAVGISIYKNWEPIKSFFADLFTSPIQQLKDIMGWIGKITGISKLFGFGDNTDNQLSAKGFKIGNGDAQGAPVGSKELTKKSNDFAAREKTARVGVDFSNLPPGAKVSADNKDGIMSLNTGSLIGGI